MDLLNLHYSPFILPLAGTALINAFLSLYAWRKRKFASAIVLSFLMAMVTVWLAANIMVILSPALPEKVFWSKLAYFGIGFVPPASLILALQYTGRDRWVTPRNLVLLSIPWF